MERIQHQKFDALVVDFDDPNAAEEVLRQAKTLGSAPFSIALVADTTKVRQILTRRSPLSCCTSLSPRKL